MTTTCKEAPSILSALLEGLTPMLSLCIEKVVNVVNAVSREDSLTSSIGESSIFRGASAERIPCVAKTYILYAPL